MEESVEILRVIDTHSGHYEYVSLSHDRQDTDKLHWLPREDCPQCGDFDQHCGKKDYAFRYCPYCHLNYRIEFTDKGVLNKRR